MALLVQKTQCGGVTLNEVLDNYDLYIQVYIFNRDETRKKSEVNQYTIRCKSLHQRSNIFGIITCMKSERNLVNEVFTNR